MTYLLTLWGDESRWATMTEEEAKSDMQRWEAFTEEARSAGVLAGGEGLEPTSAATTVRVRDGERVVTDGPFAETKEQLGGYYLLDCKDLDEAIAWAEKIPSVGSGSVEIRPVLDYEAFGFEDTSPEQAASA